MKIEQRIISLGAILVSFISYVHSDDEDCPSSPCCENKPKLGPDDKLELGFIFEQYQEGSQAVVDLYNNICKLLETCGEKISMKLISGALVKEENGEIICPDDFCFGDQDQVCSVMIDPEYGTSCKDKPPSDAVQQCIDTQTDEINGIIIENGKYREKLGIPECRVPTLTFNGVFDLCANINSYDDLLNYACELYENQLSCCNS